MDRISQLSRRGAVAVCITLSACAAAGPSGATSYPPPNAAYGAFLAAHYADARNDPAAAAKYYALALRAAPGNQAMIGQGFLAAVQAGSPQAQDQAQALAPQLSGNALAVMLLGNQAALSGDYESAGTIYAGLPQDELVGLIKPLLVAWSRFGHGNTQAALKGLLPYFNTGAFAPVYVLNAAMIADAGHDTSDAAQYYGAVSNGQPNLRLAQILASWQARQGQGALAAQELNSLMQAHPDLQIALPWLQARLAEPVVASPVQGLAEAYLTLAGALDQPAATFLRTVFLRYALQLRPDLTAARLLLANTLAGSDNPSATPAPVQMQNALDSLMPVTPDDALFVPVALQRANLLSALGRPADAVALLDKLIAMSPQDPGLLANAGDVLRAANDMQAAIPYYSKAIAAMGSPPPAGAWSLFFDRGICEDSVNNWAAAEPDMLEAQALGPDQPYVLNYIGYSWALHGEKLDQAQALLERAVALDPNDGAVIELVGFCEHEKGAHPKGAGVAYPGGGARPRRCRGERASGRCVLAGGAEAASRVSVAAGTLIGAGREVGGGAEGETAAEFSAGFVMLRRFAPAKVNLFLHVTGKRADGYHLLDSLAVFPAVGDVVGVAPGEAMSLEISGRFGGVLRAEQERAGMVGRPRAGQQDNLLLRAARALRPEGHVALFLEKNLPVASGIGGGSADAAAALRLLARYWRIETPLHEIALGLGADVPVCLESVPARMQGIGEISEVGAESAPIWHGAGESRRRGADTGGVPRPAGGIYATG